MGTGATLGGATVGEEGGGVAGSTGRRREGWREEAVRRASELGAARRASGVGWLGLARVS